MRLYGARAFLLFDGRIVAAHYGLRGMYHRMFMRLCYPCFFSENKKTPPKRGLCWWLCDYWSRTTTTPLAGGSTACTASHTR